MLFHGSGGSTVTSRSVNLAAGSARGRFHTTPVALFGARAPLFVAHPISRALNPSWFQFWHHEPELPVVYHLAHQCLMLSVMGSCPALKRQPDKGQVQTGLKKLGRIERSPGSARALGDESVHEPLLRRTRGSSPRRLPLVGSVSMEDPGVGIVFKVGTETFLDQTAA